MIGILTLIIIPKKLDSPKRNSQAFGYSYVGNPQHFSQVAVEKAYKPPKNKQTKRCPKKQSTPRKTNIEPENHPVKRKNILSNPSFLGSIVKFQGWYFVFPNLPSSTQLFKKNNSRPIFTNFWRFINKNATW